MKRRSVALILGLLTALAVAGPVAADTSPGSGHFRESGEASYFSAAAFECGRSSCTDTFVFGASGGLKDGTSFEYVCVERFTYPLKGGGRSSWAFGCAESPLDPSAVVDVNVASDLGSASATATVVVDTCQGRSCSTDTVEVSAELSAIGAALAYSDTQKSTFGNCTDTFRIRGRAADAEGTISVDGSELAAFGQIGAESWAISSRCR